MNSLGREWEIYNFDYHSGSTEYDNLLINKDIDNYFNDIINKPIIPQSNTNPIKSGGGLSKFYTDYIEHNLIFIVVLVGIIIFLVIRHYVKDFDSQDLNSHDLEKSKNPNSSDESTKQEIEKKKKINEKIILKKKKLELEKLKLINYKRELDKEKQQILSIIDELSNINEYESNKYNNTYLNQDINSMYSNNFNNYNQLNQLNQQYQQYQLNQLNQLNSTRAHNDNKIISNIDNHKDDMMDTNYYNINKNFDDKTNEIDGLYIEPPFM